MRKKQEHDFLYYHIRKAKRSLAAVAVALILGAAASASQAGIAYAMETGTYLVTVSPSYVDPETGSVEDPGHNEAIGQGMTEKLCGPTGLLEIDTDGTMYLTVRYYLSQFISDVSFEERSGSAYSNLSYQKMQTKAPVDGAADIDDKYGYTDYRMKISSMNSVFRGNAYIDPMGRSVVYFFTCTSPVSGSSDFAVSLSGKTAPSSAAQENTDSSNAQAASLNDSDHQAEDSEKDSGNTSLGEDDEERTGAVGSGNFTSFGSANGSGEADDPVTGIPEKSSSKNVAETTSKTADSSSKAISSQEYHLETVYDLAAVPVKEARRATKTMLAEATGITGMTEGDGYQRSEASVGGNDSNTNRTVMLVLLGVAAVLLLWFTLASLKEQRLKVKCENKAVEAERPGHTDES